MAQEHGLGAAQQYALSTQPAAVSDLVAAESIDENKASNSSEDVAMLSPHARRIYSELKAAMEERKVGGM